MNGFDPIACGVIIPNFDPITKINLYRILSKMFTLYL